MRHKMVQKHVNETKEIKKSHIYGLYGVLPMVLLTTFVAFMEGYYVLTIGSLLFTLFVLFFVPYYLGKRRHSFEARLIGQGIMLLYVIYMFDLITIVFATIDLENTTFVIASFLGGQLIMTFVTYLYVLRIFKKGFSKLQYSLIGLFSFNPLILYYTAKLANLQNAISITAGLVIVSILLGMLSYIPIDNFMKIYYMKKLGIEYNRNRISKF